MSSKSVIVPGSELVRCARQIRFLGLSLILILISMIMIVTISKDEMVILKKYITSKADPLVPKPSDLTLRKVTGSAALVLIAFLIGILATLFATKKGCYKTSIFAIIFAMVFGF